MEEENTEFRTEGKENFLSKIKEKPWQVTTAVLAVACLILLILALKPGVTGNVISSEDIGSQALDFFNTKLSRTPGTLDSMQEVSGIYQVDISSGGQQFPLYFTKDGNFIYQGNPLISITGQAVQNQETQTSTEVPKTDVPKVELFIWGYCPYGVQVQELLAEVASLLENSADFEAVLYYDGHGDYETQQNKIQACIQKLDKDKYWDYAAGFVKNIYPKCGQTRDINCDKTESVNLMKSLGIDSSAVMSCVDSEGEALFQEYSQRAQQYGVTGSPTLAINGVIASSSSRTAEAFKTSVCEAFNNAPEQCSEVLDSETTAASGSC